MILPESPLQHTPPLQNHHTLAYGRGSHPLYPLAINSHCEQHHILLPTPNPISLHHFWQHVIIFILLVMSNTRDTRFHLYYSHFCICCPCSQISNWSPTIQTRPSINLSRSVKFIFSLVDAFWLIMVIHSLGGIRYPFFWGTDPRLGAGYCPRATTPTPLLPGQVWWFFISYVSFHLKNCISWKD